MGNMDGMNVMDPNMNVTEANWQTGVEALKAGRVNEAVQLLETATRANPQSFEARNFLGVALAQAGRAGEAIGHLQEAVKLNPANAQAHYNLGVAQMTSGDNTGAQGAFTRALQLDANYQAPRDALAQLGVSVPVPAPAPAPPASAPDSPWGGAPATGPATGGTALTTHGVPMASTKPNFLDVLKATALGGIAAIVGAFIWDKFVFYTHIEFGLIAVGIGILVGVAVAIGAGGKKGTSLQIISALLSLFGMMLGYALIISDALANLPASSPNSQLAGAGAGMRLFVSLFALPFYFTQSPLSLLFIAIGVYEGWKLPGETHHASAPANPADASNPTSPAQPAHLAQPANPAGPGAPLQ